MTLAATLIHAQKSQAWLPAWAPGVRVWEVEGFGILKRNLRILTHQDLFMLYFASKVKVV